MYQCSYCTGASVYCSGDAKIKCITCNAEPPHICDGCSKTYPVPKKCYLCTDRPRCFFLDTPGVSRFHEIPVPTWKCVLEASRTARSTRLPMHTPDTGIQDIPKTLRPPCSNGIILPNATIIVLDRGILDRVYFECPIPYHGHGHPYHTRNFQEHVNMTRVI